MATLLFTTQPILLGLAGIANHDIPATAGTALSLLTFARWLARRTASRALLFGLAYGLAIGWKFSCIAFVPAACAALFLVKGSARLARNAARDSDRARGRGVCVVAHVSAGAASVDGVHGGTGKRHAYVARALRFVRVRPMEPRRLFLAWLASAMAILVLAMPSHLDIGVRYVLPMYVPLTIAMAFAAQHAKRVLLIAILLAWHCIASLLAHPQYLAYFNELAQPDPSRYLVDSNLDWGRDALLLKGVLREKKVDAVGLALVGMHNYRRLGYPTHYPVDPSIPATGWVAVSEHLYRRHAWRWLRGRAYERVGAAVRLYYIPHS